jgi:hypothetical protein
MEAEHRLSVGEAAALVGRDPSRIRQLIREGTLPARQNEWGFYMVTEGDLRRVFKAQRPYGKRGARIPS